MTVDHVRASLAGPPFHRVPAEERSAHRLRHAAVLIALVDRGVDTHIILEQRSETVPHPGQIGLPGGVVANGETEVDAALREAEEEIGLDRAAVAILGQLHDYVSVTRYVIAPVVGAVTGNAADMGYVRQPEEVARVFEVPLRWLHGEGRVRTERREWHRLPAGSPTDLLRRREARDRLDDGAHEVMYYDTPEGTIWGVTARILYDFVQACVPIGAYD